MKLQLENNEYYLMKDGEELAVATTDESFIKELGAERLSRKNCEAITEMCSNEHCDNGITGVIYGEEQFCHICRDLSEWDVEIEMTEDYLTWKKSDIEKMSDCLVPKLDANGCLILKKK
jgi:hypothetical protein